MKRFTIVVICLIISILPIVHLSHTYATSLPDTMIDVPILNVRDGPGLSNTVITKVYKGEHYKILDKKDGWIKIQMGDDQSGWVASWFTTEQQIEKQSQKVLTGIVTATNLNIRDQNSLNSEIIGQVSKGEEIKIISEENDWYKIMLPNQLEGWVASWFVYVKHGDSIETENTLNGKTIVLDPGHGGYDSGAISFNGEFEKDITLQFSQRVYEKLQATGANVILTRNNDEYRSLQDRVDLSNDYHADAFLSIHCDSIEESTIRGTATYFYYTRHKQLAKTIQTELIKQTGFPNRKARFGDYKVIRENNQPAILIELGFLSNPLDARILLSTNYQDNVTNAIYDGLVQYFKNSEY